MEQKRAATPERKVVCKGKWLGLETIHDPSTGRDYEQIVKTGPNQSGTKIIPLIRRSPAESGYSHVILIANFRVPVLSYVLELPAGNLDAGEKEEDCARRELKVSAKP